MTDRVIVREYVDTTIAEGDEDRVIIQAPVEAAVVVSFDVTERVVIRDASPSVIVQDHPTARVVVQQAPERVVVTDLVVVQLGGGTAESYVHVQGVASAEWVIDHPLGKFPSVDVVDSLGRWVLTSVEYVDDGQVISRSTGAFSGKAYLN